MKSICSGVKPTSEDYCLDGAINLLMENGDNRTFYKVKKVQREEQKIKKTDSFSGGEKNGNQGKS